MADRQDTDEFRLADLLPEGYIALDFVVSIKVLDEEGDLSIINGRSSELPAWEALGMLVSAADDLRAKMQQPGGDDV